MEKTKMPKPNELRFLSHLEIDEIFEKISDENPNWDMGNVIAHGYATDKAHQHKNNLETQRLQRLLEREHAEMFAGLGLDQEAAEVALIGINEAKL